MATNPLQSGGGSCAPGEVIALLAMGREAAGLLPEAEAESWMAHVAGCEKCAELLRMALAQNAAELTAEQQGIASQLTAPASGFSKPPASKRNLWLLAGAVAATLVIAFVAMQSRQQEDVPQLLAQAYTETRPFEWRLPDAGYSPVRVQRGDAQNASAELESVRTLLARDARGKSANELKLRAWFELLQAQDTNLPIDALERASRELPNDAEVRNLLGVAYARRGDLLKTEADFQRALDCWPEADGSSPQGRFNRALVLIRLKQHSAALVLFEKLANETKTNDPWLSEIRRHLERARELNGRQ